MPYGMARYGSNGAFRSNKFWIEAVISTFLFTDHLPNRSNVVNDGNLQPLKTVPSGWNTPQLYCPASRYVMPVLALVMVPSPFESVTSPLWSIIVIGPV